MSIYLVDRIPQTARFLHICISTRAHTHAPCRPERRAIPHTACDTLHALPLAMRFRSICGSSSEVKESKDTITQYTPIDEDEHKEVDRKANLNAARVFLYRGVRRFFLQQIMMFL